MKTSSNTARVSAILAIAAIVISAAVDTVSYLSGVGLVPLFGTLNTLHMSYGTYQKVLEAVPLGADVVAVLFLFIVMGSWRGDPRPKEAVDRARVSRF